MNEIEKQEKVLQELKQEYQRKRNLENRIQVHQNQSSQGFRLPQGHPQQQPARSFGYYQNYPQHPQQIHQAALYEQIPVGRPINESNNSSFATEYPQI